jgi:hypothetical protein
MFQLNFQSPVATPESVAIVEVSEPIRGAYYSEKVYPNYERAEEAQENVIAEALADWANDESGSPFWAVAPSGEQCEPPAWAAEYGFEFYDPYPGYGHSHYLHVRRSR